MPATNSSASRTAHHQRGRAWKTPGAGVAGGAGSAACWAGSGSSASAGSNSEPMRAPISAKLRRISSSSCAAVALLLVAVGGHSPPPKAWTEHSDGERRLETTG